MVANASNLVYFHLLFDLLKSFKFSKALIYINAVNRMQMKLLS